MESESPRAEGAGQRPRRALAAVLVLARIAIAYFGGLLVAIGVSCLPHMHEGLAFATMAAFAVFALLALDPFVPAVGFWLAGFLGPLGYALYAPALVGGMIATRRWRSPRAPTLVALVAFMVTCAVGARGDGDPIPPRDPRGIACIGDSSAAGIYATHSWCERIGGINFAREGATPTETLSQLEALRSARPAFVVAQVGANGHGEPAQALAHLLAETEAAVESWGGKLVVIDYPLTIWPEMRWKPELRAAVPAGAALVDPALPWYRLAADHIHPTPLGHRDIAARLRPLLVERSGVHRAG